MNKFYLAIIGLTISYFTSGQVTISEKNTTFNNGSKNSILLTIPHVTSDFVEKEIKDEMKDWGGKYNSSKGEFISTQSNIKEIGEKLFDGYAKIVDSKEGSVTVAFAFDLGGAHMNSSEHSSQYKMMVGRLKDLGLKISKDAVSEELKDEEKQLKNLRKDQENLEKSKVDLEKDIEDYKKRIEEALLKIEKNKTDQSTKTEEIKSQENKCLEVTTKLNGIK